MSGPGVRQGDTLKVFAYSSFAATLNARATALLKDGSQQTVHVPEYVTGSGIGEDVKQSLSQFRLDGRIIDGYVTGPSAQRRGQTFVRFDLIRGTLSQATICKGYQYGANPVIYPKLDEMRGPPGTGHIQYRAIADDVTPVDIEHSLAFVNTLRRIDGFAWYYHCSADVADRTLRASLRDVGDGLPTGMTSGVNTTAKLWPSAGVLTLSANQEGMIYVNANTGKSFAISLDNGAATIEDITTEPDPFPVWATDSNVGEIFFDVALAEAADRHSIYIIEENWIDI